jgi:hypothetical protein
MWNRMMALLLALIGLAPGTAVAGTRACTSQLVTAGLCRVTTNRLMSWDAPPAIATELADAIAAQEGWSASMTCSSAFVSAGICSAGQVGTAVAVTKAQFADYVLRREIQQRIRRYREQSAFTSALVTAGAATEPDISN